MKAMLPLAALLILLPLRGEEPVRNKAAEPIAGLWVLPGTHYKEVRDFKILNPATVSFTHSGGKITVPFAKVEQKYREQFGYDPKAADAYLADLAAKAKTDAEEKEQKRLDAEAAAKKAKEEAEAAKIKAEKTALILQKRNAIAGVQRSTYGTLRYWSQDKITRELADAGMAAFLRGQGFTNEEALKILTRFKHREDF